MGAEAGALATPYSANPVPRAVGPMASAVIGTISLHERFPGIALIVLFLGACQKPRSEPLETVVSDPRPEAPRPVLPVADLEQSPPDETVQREAPAISPERLATTWPTLLGKRVRFKAAITQALDPPAC